MLEAGSCPLFDVSSAVLLGLGGPLWCVATSACPGCTPTIFCPSPMPSPDLSIHIGSQVTVFMSALPFQAQYNVSVTASGPNFITLGGTDLSAIASPTNLLIYLMASGFGTISGFTGSAFTISPISWRWAASLPIAVLVSNQQRPSCLGGQFRLYRTLTNQTFKVYFQHHRPIRAGQRSLSYGHRRLQAGRHPASSGGRRRRQRRRHL